MCSDVSLVFLAHSHMFYPQRVKYDNQRHPFSCIANLLIRAHIEVIWRVDSLPKTWVKSFYVFALAHVPLPSEPNTYQIQAAHAQLRSNSLDGVKCMFYEVIRAVCVTGLMAKRTQHWSLCSLLLNMTLLLTVSPVTQSEVTGQNNNSEAT